MTRKIVYSRPLTPAQTQTIPLRQAPANSFQKRNIHDHVKQVEPARREKRQLSSELPRYNDNSSPGSETSPDAHRLTHLEVSTEGLEVSSGNRSPNNVRSPTGPSTARLPSSASQDPARKRARTGTNPERSFSSADGDRSNKCDLADLLNPSPQETSALSPSLQSEDIDTLQPLVDVATGLSQENATPSSVSGSDVGTSRTSSFATIRPRPLVYYGMLENDEDGQQTKNDGREVKKKGRKKPFESDQKRAEVLAVRDIGACLRCHIMRIGCLATEEACPKCRETLPTSRKWTIPCTRKWLKDRWQYLIPDILIDWNKPCNILPTAQPGQIGDAFTLPLTHISNFEIDLEVLEVERNSLPNTALTHRFTDQQGENPGATISLSQNPCPPLVPYLLPGPDCYRDTILQTSWRLETQLKKISKTWINQVFPWDESEAWPREVLHMVIQFQWEVARCSALDAGLKACLLRFLMNHAFHIPFEKIPEINNQLSKANRLSWSELQDIIQKEQIWSPSIVNQWVKSALLRMLEQHLGKLFKELELLFKLQETGGDQAKLSELDRDEAFCTIVVTFIVIGTMQTKLLHAANAKDLSANCPDGKLARKAKRCIQVMEDEVVDHILQLWKYRFSSQEMKGKPSNDRHETAVKAANFRFIYWFEHLKGKHRSEDMKLMGLNPKLDLSDANINSFLTHNVSRLLLRLSLALWRPKSSK